MLPDFSRLSLKPTGDFYALTEAEAAKLKADDVQDPISLAELEPNQHRNSKKATFRVRTDLPDNKSIHKFFIAKGLWDWVRKPVPDTKPAIAVMPDTRKPVWREDWWALSDRFAPGALYPRWVRNLPLRDEGTSDSMDRYETLPGLNLSGLGNLEALEGANLMADSNAFFASADAYLVSEPTVAATKALRESIETLLRGVRSLDYESEIDLPSHESTADGIGQRLIAILKRPDPAVWGRPASAMLKGYALALLARLAHGDVIQQRMRADTELPASLRAHGLAVLGNAHFDWGVERGSPGWCAQRYSGRIGTFRDAVHQVLHAYYWNRRVEDEMLVPPPSVERLEEEAARPLNDAEGEVVGKIEALQVAMEEQWQALQQQSMAQFFASGAGRGYVEKLEQIGELFKKAHDYPNEGTVRHLARNQFLTVMNAIIEMNDDPSWRDNHESDAQQLFVGCVASLGPAVAAGRLDRFSAWTNQHGQVYRHKMEEFFWRLVKRAYEGVAAQNPGMVLTQIADVVYDQLLVSYPAEGENDSDSESDDSSSDDETEEEEAEEEQEEEEEEEEEDGEPNPHDAPLPGHLRRLLEPTAQPNARRQRR
tara:strand:+ start:11 stop:1798 length:1788 start_codon:yes stop_codon:yes gene_type:complete